MISLATIRKAMNPAPVFEAQYENGDVMRASFFNEKGRALDIENGLRTCNVLYNAKLFDRMNDARIRANHNFKESYGPDELSAIHQERVAFIKSNTPALLAGWVEHPTIGRIEYQSLIPAVKAKAKKINKAQEALRAIVAWGETYDLQELVTLARTGLGEG